MLHAFRRIVLSGFLFIALLIASAFSLAAASAPSFDCKNAKAKEEKMICASEELGSLDKQMSEDFKKANDKATDETRPHIKADQENFLKDRRLCTHWPKAKQVSCLTYAYQNRIKTLESPNGTWVPKGATR